MKFHVVKSSAGSGKTYNLVKHYLIHLLQGNSPDYFRHILAVTFTNKATEEMKSRIISALEGISKGQPKYNSLSNELIDSIELNEDSLKQRCAFVLRNMLHDYGDFNISTIDQFVYRLVKSFSFEMDLASNIEIELKEDRLIRKIVDGIFDKMSTDDKLSKVLLAYSEHKFAEEQNYDPENNIVELTKEIMRSGGRKFLDSYSDFSLEDFLLIKEKNQKRLSSISKMFTDKAEQLYLPIKERGLLASDFYQSRSGVFKYLENLALGIKDLHLPNSYVQKTLNEDLWLSKKVSPENRSAFELIHDDLERGLRELILLITEKYPHYTFCKALSSQLYSMAIVNEVKKEIDEIKDEYNVARLDDFNQIISEIIRHNPVPYIYERIGEKFHHYLIDEFQDTSKIQWFNLVPLLDNALSEGYDSLVVGDAKQAIYRWRGGELDQLNQLPGLNFSEMNISDDRYVGNAIQSAYEEIILESNYRSSKLIVDFINGFFGRLKNAFPAEMSDVYSDHHQKSESGIEGGLVEVKFFPAASIEENVALETVDRIVEMANSGTELGSMAVLCRKRDQCTAIASLLLDQGISFVSEESLKLYHSSKVDYLINWMTYLSEGRAKTRAYKILEYHAKNSILGLIGIDALPNIWSENPDIEFIFSTAGISCNVSSMLEENILELVYLLGNDFIGSKNKDRYVIAFEDCVSSFINRYGNDIAEFLIWWEENKEDQSVTYPSDASSVSIMTIHKAKGLEFGTVFVPFAFGEIRKGKSHFWLETIGEDREIIPSAWLKCRADLENTQYADLYRKEEQASFTDTANLMYVAATRAKEQLIVFSKQIGNSKNNQREEVLWNECIGLEENRSELENTFLMLDKNHQKDEADSIVEDRFHYSFGSMNPWRDRIMLKYKCDTFNVGDSADDPVREGLLIHEIMSSVIELEDLNIVLKNYVRNGSIVEEKAEKLKSMIKKVISNSEVAPFFKDVNGKVFNEREMMSKSGEILRPDRCIVNEDTIVLIDYKTGAPHDSHYAQMNSYSSVASELGYEAVSTFLIYFSEGMVKRL